MRSDDAVRGAIHSNERCEDVIRVRSVKLLINEAKGAHSLGKRSAPGDLVVA
jgi:hypothetical protein